ncbi:MAG: hypothetical protein LBD85_04775 [Oscillospiraceae bacterium]|jgi:hypothetical protein|nr:hypothetical protein [Oscillospiraceae bacterium]
MEQTAIRQWPIKLNKVPANAPYFHNAHLLIAADCLAYVYPRFSERLTADKTLVLGCPSNNWRLTEQVLEILQINDVTEITLARVGSECCKSISQNVMTAIRQSGKDIPLNVMTIIPDGEEIA